MAMRLSVVKYFRRWSLGKLNGMIGMTGATGEVGGRLARRLAEHGVEQRLIVREVSRAPDLRGADVSEFGGYADPEGMRRAFAGISTIFLVSARETPNRVDLHKAAVDAAAAAGVKRVVYLSLVGAAADATFTFARDHFHTEEYIRKSGLAFTFSRQNLCMDFLPVMGGEEGVIRGPAGDGRFAPILRDDVADALTAMLTEAGHDGATYELTGPESLTFDEVSALMSEFSEHAVVYENETLEEAQASRAGYGAPAWEVEGWITTYTAIAAGELDIVTDDVAHLTGHEPVSVREFLSNR